MQLFRPFFIRVGALVLAALTSSWAQAQDAEPQSQVDLEALRAFVQVFEQIRQTYVEELDDGTLFDMALRGMLMQLDPHSEYLTPDRVEALEETTTGAYSGIGVELSMELGDLMIVAPLDDSPAAEAGLLSGDIIVRIDDRPIQGLSMAESLELLGGDTGTEVALRIYRPTTNETFDVALVYSLVPLVSVSSRVIAGDVAYIRISRFQGRTGTEFREAVEQFAQQSDLLSGLIIDLRNNPGGLLQASVEVAGVLLDGGVVVSTRGRHPGFNYVHHADPGQQLPDLPIVVLINRGTASAAEIVAGALQDHGRALILGDISFGKGSVQNMLPVEGERAIKLTTARYYTPSGRTIQARGIVPDIIVEDGQVQWQARLNALSENDLQGHLESEPADPDAPELLGMVEGISDIDDVQLAHAVSLLKGVRQLENRTVR